jgi:hypothetical protein
MNDLMIHPLREEQKQALVPVTEPVALDTV